MLEEDIHSHNLNCKKPSQETVGASCVRASGGSRSGIVSLKTEMNLYRKATEETEALVYYTISHNQGDYYPTASESRLPVFPYVTPRPEQAR